MYRNQGMIQRRGASQSATFVVAASDSLHLGLADYVCDGVDDQVEIQAAIDALPSDGGKVVLLNGTYFLSGSITAPQGSYNISIVGNGDNTVLKATTTDDVFSFIGDAPPNIYSGCDISDLVIDGDNNAPNGIHVKSWQSGTISHIKVFDCTSNAINLESDDYIVGNHHSRILNCRFIGNLILGSDSNDVIVDNILIKNGGMEVGGKYCKISNIIVIHPIAEGIKVTGGYNNLTACEVEYVTDPAGILLYGGHNVVTGAVFRYQDSETSYCIKSIGSKNTIDGANIDGNNGNGGGIEITSQTTVTNSIIMDMGGDGIHVYSGSGAYRNVVISGNYISNAMRGIYGRLRDSLIIGNTIEQNQYPGILVVKDSKNVSIIGNALYGDGLQLVWWPEIYITDTANGIIVANNVIDGNGQAKYGIQEANGCSNNQYKNNYITNVVTTSLFLEGANNMWSEQHSDLFMDVLAASPTAVHSAITGTGAEQEVTTGITNPDVPRNVSITTTDISSPSGNVTITGIDAKGNSITEDIAISAGGTAYGNKAFATVSKITIPDGVTADDTVSVGISDKLGLSNIIYESGDVYKVKKNNADATIGTVNITYGTVDCATISGGDDFTIYYKSNLNVIA